MKLVANPSTITRTDVVGYNRQSRSRRGPGAPELSNRLDVLQFPSSAMSNRTGSSSPQTTTRYVRGSTARFRSLNGPARLESKNAPED